MPATKQEPTAVLGFSHGLQGLSAEATTWHLPGGASDTGPEAEWPGLRPGPRQRRGISAGTLRHSANQPPLRVFWQWWASTCYLLTTVLVLTPDRLKEDFTQSKTVLPTELNEQFRGFQMRLPLGAVLLFPLLRGFPEVNAHKSTLLIKSKVVLTRTEERCFSPLLTHFYLENVSF